MRRPGNLAGEQVFRSFAGFGGYNAPAPRRAGLGAFGKGFIAPPPAVVNNSESEMIKLQREQIAAQNAQMAQLIAMLQRGVSPSAAAASVGVPVAVGAATATLVAGNPNPTAADVVKAGLMTPEGIIQLPAADKMLTSAGQTKWTPSTDDPNANLEDDDYRVLRQHAPANWNEERYLQLYPDVATAVKLKRMPSGLWHYVKYGRHEGRAFAGWRSLGGVRRPGNLAGIRSNWNQR